MRRGPFQVRESHVFPKNKDGRAFSHSLFYRKMPNGERVKRSWLSYSEVNDAVFCYSCKLFSTQVIKLIKGGLNDWKNIHTILRSHENSSEHISTMQKWRELELRSTTGQTRDQRQMTPLEEERQRWRNVFTRLLVIIQSLAERNLGFKGSTDKLNVSDNGHFLKEVELLEKFDPVMQEH